MPLQRQFRGLPDHIGRYEGGTIPQELDPELQIQISGEDFLNPYDWISSQSALTAAGQIAVMPAVPEGEIHRVRAFGCNVLAPTAQITCNRIVVSDRTGQFIGLSVELKEQNFVTAGTTEYQGLWFGGNELWLYSGQQLGVVLTGYVGAGNANFDLAQLRQVIRI